MASPSSATSLEALRAFQQVFERAVRQKNFDLSARQTAIFFAVYLSPPPHSVKSFAESLNISKPAICRAVDHLSRLGLVKRWRDPKDKRKVMIQRTVKGSVFLMEFSEILLGSAAAAAVPTPPQQLG